MTCWTGPSLQVPRYKCGAAALPVLNNKLVVVLVVGGCAASNQPLDSIEYWELENEHPKTVGFTTTRTGWTLHPFVRLKIPRWAFGMTVLLSSSSAGGSWQLVVAGGCTVSEQSVLSSVERLTLDWPVPPFTTMASSVSPPQHDDDMAIVSGASSWCCSFSCLTRPRTDCTMELVRKPPHDTAPILIGRGLDSCETLFEMKDGPDSTSHCHDTRRRGTTKDLPNEKGQELAALELAFQRVVTLKDPDEPHDDRNESRHHQGTTIRPMLDDDDNSPAAAASTIPTTVHELSLDFEHLHLLDS